MLSAITIGIVDDHSLFREEVCRSLSEINDFIVVGEGASGADATGLACLKQPDVLLLDVSMPVEGTEVVGDILPKSPRTRVLMLSPRRKT